MVKVIEPMKVCKLFGACATVSAIRNAIPLIHSPCGCQYYIRAELLLHDRIDPTILCSDLSQKDVIFGGEERLENSIIACQAEYDPDLIVILSSCAPALIGDDILSVAEKVKNEVRANIIAIDSAGFRGDHVSGFKDVTLAIIANYAQDGQKVKNNVVNIIGIIPGYDYRWRHDIISLINTLSLAGIRVNAVFGGMCSLDQIKESGSAALNIVLSDIRGLEIAKYLKSRFGTPFLSCDYLPIGIQSTREWIRKISQHLSSVNLNAVETKIDEKIKLFEYAELGLITTYSASTTIAIVSEPYRALGLAKFLTQELGLSISAICPTEADANIRDFLERNLKELGQESCELILDQDAYEMQQSFRRINPSIIFGSSFESQIAHELNAKLIKMNFPVYDQLIITDRPYMGINGITVLMEDIFNAIVQRNF